MTKNRGATILKCRRSRRNTMSDYDRLPPELRKWVARAILPWRAGSVRAAFEKAMLQTNDPCLAIKELDRLQQRLVAKDARQIWGITHPDATPSEFGPRKKIHTHPQ